MPEQTAMQKRHLVVFVLNNDGGEYLLHFRDGNQGIIHPLQWSFFGGHKEPGERIERTAQRELEEEIGVHVAEEHFALVDTLEYPDRVYHIMECRRPINWTDIRLQEGAGCGFFGVDELQRLENCSPLIDWLRERTLGKASAAN